MVVADDGALPLPWLAPALAAALAAGHRGHALLLDAAPGNGALPLALTLAQSLLCEDTAPAQAACGRCAACRLVQARVHPDLFVLLPQALRREHDWPLADDREADDGKRKPSRQVRVGEIRGLVDWVTRTASRGRGKVAVVHPADAMNPAAANALLKTLEEPPSGTRIVITAADPARLLPTVASRCQTVALHAPAAATAQAWLAAQGVTGGEVLLAAAGGRPLDAQALAGAGIDAAAWARLPAAVARGDAAALSGWPVPAIVDALAKLCHDAMAQAVGTAPRFFPPGAVPRGATLPALVDWQRDLLRLARNDEHPWHEPLLVDALVAAAAAVLGSAPPPSSPVAQRRFATLPR